MLKTIAAVTFSFVALLFLLASPATSQTGDSKGQKHSRETNYTMTLTCINADTVGSVSLYSNGTIVGGTFALTCHQASGGTKVSEKFSGGVADSFTVETFTIGGVACDEGTSMPLPGSVSCSGETLSVQ